MTLEVTVDRIEGNLAVLDINGTPVDWPIDSLPPGISEGDRVSVALTVRTPDPSDAQARLERLRSKSGSGDISL